jgi:hypothetical protein
MAHFAELDESNVVLRVITFSNDEVSANGGDQSVQAENFVAARHGGTWKQTSYNNNFRKRYAGIGSTYDEVKDIFMGKKPYPSWVINADDEWESPIGLCPEDGRQSESKDSVHYYWDEDAYQADNSTGWIEHSDQTQRVKGFPD